MRTRWSRFAGAVGLLLVVAGGAAAQPLRARVSRGAPSSGQLSPWNFPGVNDPAFRARLDEKRLEIQHPIYARHRYALGQRLDMLDALADRANAAAARRDAATVARCQEEERRTWVEFLRIQGDAENGWYTAGTGAWVGDAAPALQYVSGFIEGFKRGYFLNLAPEFLDEAVQTAQRILHYPQGTVRLRRTFIEAAAIEQALADMHDPSVATIGARRWGQITGVLSLFVAPWLAPTRAEAIAAEEEVQQALDVSINYAGRFTEQLAAGMLQQDGYQIIGRQVAVRTSRGLRFLDFLVRSPSGEVLAVEVKSGQAVRSAGQLAKDAALADVGGVFVGKNAPVDAFGVSQVGQPTGRLRTIELRLP